jgi:hypothetical protein
MYRGTLFRVSLFKSRYAMRNSVPQYTTALNKKRRKSAANAAYFWMYSPFFSVEMSLRLYDGALYHGTLFRVKINNHYKTSS